MARKKKEPSVIEQLREAIRDSGQTLRQLGRAADVGPDQLSRFLRNQRSLTLPAVERLCRTLKLQLVPIEPAREEE